MTDGPGISKTAMATRLLLFSALYGLFMVNYIDLTDLSTNIFYHLWLGAMYFVPFIPAALVDRLDNWELTLSLGLVASMMNDLFYAPIGLLLKTGHFDLVQFYSFQLGLQDNAYGWTFRGGPVSFPVTSFLMALSILARAGLTVTVTYRWWKTEP